MKEILKDDFQKEDLENASIQKMRRHKKSVAAEQFPYRYEDVPYGEEAEQRLDIFLPSEKGVFPVVFVVHGGGWVSCTKRCQDHAAMYKIISQGYALVSVEYHLAPESKWPVPIKDVMRALDFVIENADNYRLDVSHLTVWGNSAGGHLIEMAAGLDSREVAEGKRKAPRIAAVLCWYGCSNLTPEKPTDGSFAEQALLGGKFTEIPQTFYDASPISHVTKCFPRILLQHGVEDALVSWKQSRAMHERVTAVCGPERSTLELFPGGHGCAAIKCDENVRRCIRFLDEVNGIHRENYDFSLPEIILEDREG